MSRFLSTIIFFVLLVCATDIQAQTIVYIGDSITDGAWGRSKGTDMPSEERNHTDYNHIFGHSYMFISASKLMADYPGRYICHNRGISGNAVSDLEGRWDKDVLSLNPDVVSILVGTNDIHRVLADGVQFDAEDWERHYCELLDKTLRNNPNVKFVLGTPFVVKVGKIGESENYPDRERWVNQCAEIVRKIAVKYGAKLVDYNELFKLLDQPSLSYWSWDGIHPTPAGHHKMATIWLDVFLK